MIVCRTGATGLTSDSFSTANNIQDLRELESRTVECSTSAKQDDAWIGNNRHMGHRCEGPQDGVEHWRIRHDSLHQTLGPEWVTHHIAADPSPFPWLSRVSTETSTIHFRLPIREKYKDGHLVGTELYLGYLNLKHVGNPYSTSLAKIQPHGLEAAYHLTKLSFLVK